MAHGRNRSGGADVSTLHRPPWVEYVAVLVHADEGTVAHEIGKRVWELSTTDAIFVYLTEVMTDPPTRRAYEIAWDIWALLSGRCAA